jgi:signal transduction histidine kinase
MARLKRPVIGILTAHLLDLRTEQWLGSVDAAAASDADLICFIGWELESPIGFRSQANAIYDLVTESRLDALVIWTSTLELYVGHERMLKFCERLGSTPIVSVERDLGRAPVVAMTDESGMHNAVSHLIDVHALTRIAFVRGPSTHLGAEQRYQGYLRALSDHGLPVDEALVSPPFADWTPTHSANFARRVLEDADHWPLDAIATASDDLALGVLSEIRSRGANPRREIAVVGFDGFINARSHDVGFDGPANDGTGAVPRAVNVSTSALSLTTVRAPFYDMGRRAVELALALVRGEDVPQRVTIPTELRVRRSCGCFPDAQTPDEQSREPGRSAEAATLPGDWENTLAAAYIAELRGDSDVSFLTTLDGYVSASMRAGAGIEGWWPTLSALRRLAREEFTDPAMLARAEELWLRVQLMLNESFERSWRYTEMLTEKRNQIIHEVGQRLITAPDLAGLAKALAEDLPRVGIPSCYVAAYESEHLEGAATPSPPRGWARALLAYEDGNALDLDETELVFRSHELVPGQRLDRRERYSLVAAPLYFKQEQLGFVLFELGPRIGWIYEALQEQVSSAMQGALLVQRERRALMAIEDAHAELEQRVRDRTAELAQANEVLTEQIIERERAQLRQAALEAQLRHAQKMEAIGRLAGGIAHDFNNLLVVINGNSGILLNQLPQDDPMRADVADIQYAGERAANLTRQLLAFSRQQVLQLERIDLNQVIIRTDAMLRRLVGDSVQVTTELAPGVPPVWADAGQVEQIIFNLAVNARDAMPKGGTLHIETTSETLDAGRARELVGLQAGDYVVLRVRDTGMGMEDNVQAQIFEPFFTTKPTGHGTGLGLATVFGILQQSGGYIGVTSAPGIGTTFDIYLPQADSAAATTVTAARTAPQAGGDETLLLVEDDTAVRNVARRVLSEYGYTVLEAENGIDALHVWEERSSDIDLVITDVVMPGMGGRELVTRLIDLNANTPVLFVSGYTDDSAQTLDITEEGPVLRKPFSASALAEKVRETLDRKL